MSTFCQRDLWLVDEHVETLWLTADEEIGRVAECIFLHPHSEQTRDRTPLVCPGATQYTRMHK